MHYIGMTVTNNIRNNVLYDNKNGWKEEDLENNEILEKLKKEKQKGFLSFSWRNILYKLCTI